MKTMVIEGAYWMIDVGDGDRVVEIPVIMNAMSASTALISTSGWNSDLDLAAHNSEVNPKQPSTATRGKVQFRTSHAIATGQSSQCS